MPRGNKVYNPLKTVAKIGGEEFKVGDETIEKYTKEKALMIEIPVKVPEEMPIRTPERLKMELDEAFFWCLRSIPVNADPLEAVRRHVQPIFDRAFDEGSLLVPIRVETEFEIKGYSKFIPKDKAEGDILIDERGDVLSVCPEPSYGEPVYNYENVIVRMFDKISGDEIKGLGPRHFRPLVNDIKVTGTLEI